MAETYQPSEQARRAQEAVASFEKKRLEVERLRAQLLSRQVAAQPELKAIGEDIARRKDELSKEFNRAQALFEKKIDDLDVELQMRCEQVGDEMNVLEGRLNSEKNSLLGIKRQLEAALRKMDFEEAVRPASPIELAPPVDAGSR